MLLANRGNTSYVLSKTVQFGQFCGMMSYFYNVFVASVCSGYEYPEMFIVLNLAVRCRIIHHLYVSVWKDGDGREAVWLLVMFSEPVSRFL